MSYLMDTNSFVTPSRLYYQFSMFPRYWDYIRGKIEDGIIVLLDKVRDEILAPGNKDDLAVWFEGLEVANLINHKEQEIINAYAAVMQSIQADRCYKESAISVWSEKSTADPWLIAAAKVYGLSIVTFETRNNSLNPFKPSRQAKIPDIAEKFNVPVIDLFNMLKELQFRMD